jgi:hypothetical protein
MALEQEVASAAGVLACLVLPPSCATGTGEVVRLFLFLFLKCRNKFLIVTGRTRAVLCALFILCVMFPFPCASRDSLPLKFMQF